MAMTLLDFTGHSTAQLAFIGLAAFLAGAAKGFSGFGAALIFVPLASAAVGPRLAVPILLVIDAVAGSGMIPGAWRLANRREVGVMALGAMVGVPLGTWVLAQTDPLLLRWLLVILVAALLALIMSGWRYHGKPATPLTVGVGAIAGIFSGAAQVGGPPVVVYWLGGAANHQVVRANIVLYFAVSTVFSAVSYFAGGLITMQVLTLSLIGAPAYGIGTWVGSSMFSRADASLFRRICYCLIAFAALAGLPLWDSLRG